MENTSIRLQKYMKITGLKQVDILERCKPYCDKYNVKMGKSLLSQYVSGAFEPKQKNLTILAQALDVSEVWLMGYDVPMERTVATSSRTLTATENKLLDAFDRLNQDGQQKATEYIEDLAGNDKYKKDNASFEETNIA